MTQIPEALRLHVNEWLENHPLSPIHIDCANTVMLKILDGKCKMKPESKVVMALLYDALEGKTGELLGQETIDLIEAARPMPDEAMKNVIYEQRLMAETMISRPVMKGFKAMIKEEGLLNSPAMSELVFKE